MRTTAGHIAIVGAGSIGVAWSVVFARAGAAVRIHDPDAVRLAAVPQELRSRLDDLREFELLGEEPDEVAARVRVVPELVDAVAESAYVQECAPEDVKLKQELFSRLDSAAPPRTVLASSSSAIPCSAFAAGLGGRERCLVAHPGNPPYLLPAVELVPAPFTSEKAVAAAAETLEQAGMSVVRLRAEVEGFVFNRLQGALLREAYCLVRDGVVDVDDLDRVVRDGLGRRWAAIGPFETADLNTRDGIEAHAARLGPAYERMGAERGQHDPWTPDLVRRVAGERRRLLPLERWEERVAWRDRMLMQLERARRGGRGPADRDPTVDRLAIERVLYRYCAMLDRMDLDLVPDLFTNDCVVVYGPEERMRSLGAADLASSLQRLWRFARTSHHLSNVEIDLVGEDEARSRSYVLAWHQEPDGRSRTLYAQYHDRFVRTAAGWRISERRQFTNGSDVPWDLALAEAERLPGEA
jgi:3-hydroxyacyl-CoA dehydrogenase/3-phenylpropionate/cinnamic acid dioxygenase small subunit